MFQIFFVLLIFLVCFVLMDSQIRVHLVTLRGLEGEAEREGTWCFLGAVAPAGGGGFWGSCWRTGAREVPDVLAAEARSG